MKNNCENKKQNKTKPRSLNLNQEVFSLDFCALVEY